MKQGRASISGPLDRKVEPKPHAIDPGAVANIGLQQVKTVAQPLHEGRGYKAPAIASNVHSCGSQGKHR